ncbi:putative transcription factor interactor and regulator CCHC(Zn) family [Arabidopsis thaliana]
MITQDDSLCLLSISIYTLNSSHVSLWLFTRSEEESAYFGDILRKRSENPSKTVRKRKKLSSSKLGFRRLDNQSKKDQLFNEPLFTGFSNVLLSVFKKDCVASKSYFAAPKEPASVPVSSPTREAETEINPASPVTQSTVPISTNQESTVQRSSGQQTEHFQGVALKFVLPGLNILEYMLSPPPRSSPFRTNGFTIHPETWETGSYRTQPSTSNNTEELHFLEEGVNTPVRSPVTQDSGGFSGRTRALAQHLKERCSGYLSLNKILEGKTRKIAARMFYETLGEVPEIVQKIIQEVRQSLKSRLMEILRLPFKKRFSWNERNRSLHEFKVDGNKEVLYKSSKGKRCFECKGFRHMCYECANLMKEKEKKFFMSDSEIDSDDGEELKNLVAFTTFESSIASASASGPASASTTGSTSASATGPATGSDNDQSDDDDLSISDEEFDENYKALYEHCVKVVEENSVLTKEKLKLEAKVVKTLKFAAEKEEEASQAKVQLEETQKNLRMLNNGTKKLGHILSIGKTDKCGLGFKGNPSKSDPVFVYGGKITSASGTVKETATVAEIASDTRTDSRTDTETASGTRKVQKLQSEPRRVFRPVCHHCGVVGHIRPRCFRLLREKNRLMNAYDVRFHGPKCYHYGVQGHIKTNCFRFIRECSHEGLRRNKVWVRKDDFHGSGGENDDVFGDVVLELELMSSQHSQKGGD